MRLEARFLIEQESDGRVWQIERKKGCEAEEGGPWGYASIVEAGMLFTFCSRVGVLLVFPFCRALQVMTSGILWLLERCAAPRGREKLRALREEFKRTQQAQMRFIRRLASGDLQGGFLALEELGEQQGDEKIRAYGAELREWCASWENEKRAWKEIVRQAGGDLASEAQGYRDYLHLHPESRYTYHKLAAILQRSGDRNGAIEILRQVAERPEGTAFEVSITCITLGDAFSEAGDPRAAIVEYRRAVRELGSDHPALASHAALQLGLALDETGDRRGAREAWALAKRSTSRSAVKRQAGKLLRERL